NDGLIEGFVGLVLSRKYNRKFAFYLSSIFYDNDRNGFIQNPSPVSFIKYVEGLIKRPMFKYLIKRCDIFHPISRSMGEYFSSSTQGKTVLPLPLCSGRSFLDHERRSSDRSDDDITLIYIGQITSTRKMEFLVDVLDQLIKRSGNRVIRLKLVGRSFERGYVDSLKTRAKEYGIAENLVMVDEVPIDDIPGIMEDADIGLSLLPPIPAYRISSPTKVVEYLSVGLPVVGNREIIDQSDVIVASGGGNVSNYELEDSVEAILTLMSSPEGYTNIGKKGQTWIKKNRTYSMLASELMVLYKKETG
ncbi:MAG: glycosyltransferase, partial [Thermoplasmata archaeon]|nr:glycosyltransferase [Thermoplasmata archaeon]